MSRHNLLERRRDPNDRRNVLVQRTLNGALYLEALAEMIREKAAALDESPAAAQSGPGADDDPTL